MIEIRHTEKTQAAYNDIYTGAAIQQMDSYFIWLCSLLGIGEGTAVLDIATGRGQLVEFARDSGAKAYGLDFSLVACKHASARAKHHILSADAQILPFPDSEFDTVTNIGSLEHFENMDIAIQEMYRVLKPGGKACLMVPNTFGLRWNVQYAWRTGDVDDDGQPLQRYGTRSQWEKLLENNGLLVKQVLGYEHERAFPRTRHDLLNYLKHPRSLISLLFIIPLLPVNMAGQFIFICEPDKI